MTAILTNPIWVVKVRTFTAPPNSPAAHRGLWRTFLRSIYSSTDGYAGGFSAIYHGEGWRGLYRGTSLALFGVSNGALQFMGYEKMKGWGFERKRRRFAKQGRAWTTEDDKLVCHVTRPLRTSSKNPHPPYPHKKVKYGIYGHVCRVETRRAIRDLSVPGRPLAHTGALCLFPPPLSVLTQVVFVRSTRRWRAHIIARSRRPSHILGRTRASRASTAAWRRTLFACSLGHVSRLSCTKILPGC